MNVTNAECVCKSSRTEVLIAMTGIIDWVNRRVKRGDVEAATEVATERRPAGRRSAERPTAPAAEPDDGVYVFPTPITAGDSITVRYTGALAQAGAERVYLHMGFGRDTWERVSDVPMEKKGPRTFEARLHLPLEETSRFRFCFKDDAGRWDNNNGRDWSYEIHHGELGGLA